MLHVIPQVHGKQAGAAADRTPSFYFTQLPLVEMLCREKASGLEPPSLERR
jgi:hypothetical protein